MNWIAIVAKLFEVSFAVFAFAGVRVAAQADEDAERLWKEHVHCRYLGLRKTLTSL